MINTIDGVMTFNLDYSKRHCWPRNDGTHVLDGSFDGELCKKYKEHPKRAGKSEFLRFIHNFPVDGVFTEFPEGSLSLGNEIMIDGTVMYCENYNNRIKCFLDVERGIATIEVWDPELEWAIPVTLNEVEREYELL